MSLPRRLLTALTGLALLSAALVLPIVTLPSLAAGSGDVYTVSQVPVDVTAGSAAQAREQALERGHREAFRRLVGRIVPRGETQALPEASYDRLANMVRDFQVENERTSNVRYLADLTIRFRPDAVRDFLRENNVAYAETVSSPVVVLPVFGEAESAVLWDDPNPWREVWNRREAQPGLVPITVPLGDLGDIQAISASEALQNDQEALMAIAERSDAGDVVVAHLMLDGDPDSGDAVARVVSSRTGLSGPQRTTVQTVRQAQAITLDELLERAAEVVIEDLEAAWKQANLIHFEDAREMSVTVPLRGLEDWTSVQERLSGVAVVGDAALRRFSRGTAELDMIYYGDPAQLKMALRQSRLSLEESDDGRWRLYPSEAQVERPSVPLRADRGAPSRDGLSEDGVLAPPVDADGDDDEGGRTQ